MLLGRILRREPLDSWFWPLVDGTAVETSRSERVLAIVERLREMPASWLAVADSVLTAIAHGDPSNLLTLLPLATVNSWLRELSPRQIPSARSRPVRLPQIFDVMLRRSIRTMGSDDRRVVWLAALAVLQVVPSELSSGMVVNRAKSTLRNLAAEPKALLSDHSDRGSIPDYGVPLRADKSVPDSLSSPQRKLELSHPQSQRIDFDEEVAESAATVTNQTSQHEPSFLKYVPAEAANPLPPAAIHFENVQEPISYEVLPEGEVLRSDRIFLGAPTRAAGLYFLLNVLRLLGIAEAIQSNPLAAESGLVARILQRLAVHARIMPGDAILSWIDLSLSQIEKPDVPPAGTFVSDCSTLFPSNLQPSSQKSFDVGYFSRVWSLAVRRWCWHAGALTVRELVHRNGVVSLNRCDLDVTLPLDSVDIRIRRLGLDIDPGWLPWFGKVVRFHYVWDESAHVH